VNLKHKTHAKERKKNIFFLTKNTQNAFLKKMQNIKQEKQNENTNIHQKSSFHPNLKLTLSLM